MNKVAIVGGTLAVFVVAAVAMAAGPTPSTSPTASPIGSPMASSSPIPTKAPTQTASPSATPMPSSSAGSAATPAQQKTWTSDVNPVDIQGTATLTQNSDGTGTLLLQLTGIVNETNWTVDVEPGAIQHPNDSNTIAFKQGSDVQKVAPDKIQVQLTKSEMDDFHHALGANPNGVTIFVSDGHRLSAATLSGTAQ
jgi:hypothetical protein